MTTIWGIVYLALFLLFLLVLTRVVIDLTRLFARSWYPSGLTAVGLETVYTVTDPPIRALRRLIPPLRVGPVSIDLSVWVLFLLIAVARGIVGVQVA